MFDAVRNNKKIVQVFLALITLPFAFWGVESYIRNAASTTEVASVGKAKITQQEFQASFREYQDRIRQQMGGRMPQAALESPAMRRAALDSMVNQRLLSQLASEGRITVTDADLARFIASIPALQEGGKFSPERYAALVAGQGLTTEAFEYRLRADLSTQQLVRAVGDGAIAGRATADRWIDAQLERRDVAELRLAPDSYLSKVSIADDAVARAYEERRERYQLPEQVRVEYLLLTQEAVTAQARPTDDEIKARYESQRSAYSEPGMRRASHILIRLDKSANDADSKAAQAKADDVLAQVRKTPAEFARIAREHSQDPGSATKGGDLDWFGRGMMVKPFEDAAFGLKENEISGIVRSDFGLHIIRVTGVREEKLKPLAEVRGAIAAELQKELGAKRFAEAAETFGNYVYEQADSLKPAAEKLKLEIRGTDWLSKGGRLPAPFDQEKIAAAIFTEDAVKHRRNTEAIELGRGKLISARVVEHRAPAMQPLETVRDGIRKRLQSDEAARLAQKDGAALLERLTKGDEVKLAWSPVRSLQRLAAASLPPEAARPVFQADAGKLPAYVGAALPNGGYALYRISAVRPGEEDAARRQALAQQYARAVAEEEFTGWMSALRERFPVIINSAALEPKQP